MTINTYLDALQKAVPGAIYHADRVSVWIDVPCNGCGRLVKRAWHGKSRMPPVRLSRILKERGWTVGNRKNKHICPDHQPMRTIAEVWSPDPGTVKIIDVDEREDEMTETVEMSPSDKARNARRETILLLEEVFNPETGRFKAGEDDASVASVTGLSTEAVGKLREEFYGPLKVPGEIEAALAELTGISKSITATREHFTGELIRLENRVADVQKRVDALVEKNGWKRP